MRTLLYQILVVLLFFMYATVHGQVTPRDSWKFLEPSDTFNKKRFWLLAGTGAAAYTAASVGLYAIWYRDYPQSKFHLFNDFGEWEHMDKAGHMFTAYFESNMAFNGARWIGIRHKPAVLVGAGVSTLLQSTIEVMDGFSSGWGFSLSDVASNTLGTGIFVAQELLWEDQRIQIKVSNSRPNYTNDIIRGNPSGALTQKQIAHGLFGNTYSEAFIKDYNGMTVWASVNPSAFMRLNPESRFPRWLNIAFGYGAQNVYGAYGNAYTDPRGNVYFLNDQQRYRQYYLAIDVDLRRIRTKSRLLKTIFTGLSWLKFPAPAMEWNTLKQNRFHWIYW